MQKLAKASIIKQSHIGIPANTQRDVVDNSYDVSWLAFFNNAEEQDSYQTDPDSFTVRKRMFVFVEQSCSI